MVGIVLANIVEILKSLATFYSRQVEAYIMLSSCTNTLRSLMNIMIQPYEAMLTFWELTARLSWAKSEEGSTVPRKIDLYWFMPALANSKVGSE
jgi:hypothetical protein